MEAYELESRTCICGQAFKVLKTSTQMHHSTECAKNDPNYKPPEVQKRKLNVAKIVENIESGAPLTVDTKKGYSEAIKEERKREEKTLYTEPAQEDPKAKWEAAVSEAKSIVNQMKMSRLRIAELALSVCEVQYGGNWRAFARIYTVKNFAHDINVHPKTLHQWIRIKRNIHDQLPEGDWVEDWGLAVRVDHKVGSKPSKAKVIEMYRKEKNRNKPMRRFQTVTKSMNNFLFLVQKKTILKDIPKEDLKAALETTKAIQKSLSEWV